MINEKEITMWWDHLLLWLLGLSLVLWFLTIFLQYVFSASDCWSHRVYSLKGEGDHDANQSVGFLHFADVSDKADTVNWQIGLASLACDATEGCQGFVLEKNVIGNYKVCWLKSTNMLNKGLDLNYKDTRTIYQIT